MHHTITWIDLLCPPFDTPCPTNQFYFLCGVTLEQISSLEAMITGLQEALPKSIGLLPLDGGVTGIF